MVFTIMLPVKGLTIAASESSSAELVREVFDGVMLPQPVTAIQSHSAIGANCNGVMLGQTIGDVEDLTMSRQSSTIYNAPRWKFATGVITE